MSWNKFVREYKASMRRIEREQARNYREEVKRQKQWQKEYEQDMAQLEVEEYEEQINNLIGAHWDSIKHIDWHQIVRSSGPIEPINKRKLEKACQQLLDHYRPNFLVRILGLSNFFKSKLIKQLETAKISDQKEYEEAYLKYEQAKQEFLEDQEVAKKIVAGDLKTYREVISNFSPASQVYELGGSVQVMSLTDKFAEIIVTCMADDIVPREEKKLLKSKKLSSKEMPITKFNLLYQDYICSSALNVLRDYFAILPLDEIDLTVQVKMLNKSNGHLEILPILLIQAPRRTIEQLNFLNLDPSDSMKNFNHRMEFKARDGFFNIELKKIA